MGIPNESKFLSMFHINTRSLSKNFGDLEDLLQNRNMNFDIIASSETRTTKNINKVFNIDLITMPSNSPLLNPQQEEL